MTGLSRESTTLTPIAAQALTYGKRNFFKRVLSPPSGDFLGKDKEKKDNECEKKTYTNAPGTSRDTITPSFFPSVLRL
jgi:hypothetical protein